MLFFKEETPPFSIGPSHLSTQQAAKSILYSDTKDALHVDINGSLGKEAIWANHAWQCELKRLSYQCSISVEPLRWEDVEYKPVDGSETVFIENFASRLSVSLSLVTDQGDEVEIHSSQSKRFPVIPDLMNSDGLVRKKITYGSLRIVDQRVDASRYQLITKVWVEKGGTFLPVAQQISHPVDFCSGTFFGARGQRSSEAKTTITEVGRPNGSGDLATHISTIPTNFPQSNNLNTDRSRPTCPAYPGKAIADRSDLQSDIPKTAGHPLSESRPPLPLQIPDGQPLSHDSRLCIQTNSPRETPSGSPEWPQLPTNTLLPRKYPCPYCDKAYTRAQHLKRHRHSR